MGRYDLSQEAADTDTELSGLINKLGAIDSVTLASLLPAEHQQEINRLITAVNAATDENNKRAALTEQLGTLSVAARDILFKVV